MEFVCETSGSRAGSSLYHVNDGFFFRVTSSDRNRAYLKCREKSCRSRSVMPILPEHRSFDSFVVTGEHNHGPDLSWSQVTALRQKILERCRLEVTEFRVIYDEECGRYPVEVASRSSFNQLKSAMFRARKSETERIPQTLSQYATMLSADNCRFSRTIDGGQFYMGSVIDDQGGVAVVFSSPTFLNMIGTCQELHVDGTFKVRPRVPPSRQLLTVMAMHFSHAFPVFFILMDSKHLVAYQKLFDFLKQLAPQLQPRLIITDFERSLQQALHLAFPESQIVGCWFHSANAMRKKARMLGLTRIMQENVAAETTVKMCLALPLLPSDHIQHGLEAIKTYSTQNNLLDRFQDFFNYVQRVWIQGVGAPYLSVHGQIRRTNNDQESYHSLLLLKMRRARPNVWIFNDVLIQVERAYVTKYMAYVNGSTDEARDPAYLAQDARIRSASALLQSGHYSVLEFLQRVRHAIRNSVDTQAVSDEEEEDEAIPEQPPHGVDLLSEGAAAVPELGQAQTPRHPRGQRSRHQQSRRLQGPIPQVRGRGRTRGVTQGRGRARGQGESTLSDAVLPTASTHPPPPTPPHAPPTLAPSPQPAAATSAASPYHHYRVVPTCVGTHFMETHLVELQRQDLQMGIAVYPPSPDEDLGATAGQPTCLVCQLNRCTRACSPCGHVVMCGSCVQRFIAQETFHSVTAGDGTIVETNIRLPLTCPTCRSIIGQLIRIF